jgi:hypothetical protein
LGIDRALGRFEEVMAGAWPTWFAQLQPGLDDEGIQRLRDATAPYLVPAQVEALYRWRNGGDLGVFGGWRMRPLQKLIEFYQFTYEELESPRTWLPIFDDHIVNIVTLDVPGLPPSDPSVWHGHTHDAWLYRIFDSIEALLDVVCDASESGALTERHGQLGLDDGEFTESVDGRVWSALRLGRSPGAYRAPAPPQGTELSRSAAPDWPREWLLPLGVADDNLTLRGATHTIAQLLSEAAHGPVQATIRGRVVTGSGGDGWWSPVVDDGTGRIVVSCDTTRLPITVGMRQDGEFDVILETATAPDPILDEDPRVAAIANRLRPTLPTARATGARPIPASRFA